MNVKNKLKITDAHSIEWGNATWNNNEKSIRNRYDNIQTNKFNKSGSSEIPWNDFKEMIQESIKQDEFNNSELSEILNQISNKLKTL